MVPMVVKNGLPLCILLLGPPITTRLGSGAQNIVYLFFSFVFSQHLRECSNSFKNCFLRRFRVIVPNRHIFFLFFLFLKGFVWLSNLFRISDLDSHHHHHCHTYYIRIVLFVFGIKVFSTRIVITL
jgi:hypothetical protein